jgi:hypothetical protein
MQCVECVFLPLEYQYVVTLGTLLTHTLVISICTEASRQHVIAGINRTAFVDVFFFVLDLHCWDTDAIKMCMASLLTHSLPDAGVRFHARQRGLKLLAQRYN